MDYCHICNHDIRDYMTSGQGEGIVEATARQPGGGD
jgi:hypothetical protein